MSDIWVTVPTAGRATLEAAIDSTGVPRERVVVVATREGVVVPDGCRSLLDLDEINIHRWWNVGIRVCTAHGARYVAVINDDVRLDADTLPTLLGAMTATRAALATPGSAGHVTDPSPHLTRTLIGSCWLLDTETGLRPDERYRWWYGDDDLDLRARRDHGGIATADCHFEHLHPNELTATTPELIALTELDAQRWADR